jgi:GntR family transcriptional regulator
MTMVKRQAPHPDSLDNTIVIDRSSPIPLYYQVAQQLEDAIKAGGLPPGVRLDNEVELADQLGLSRPTMRRAMQYLVEKGLIVRRRGIGTRVVSPNVRRALQLTSLYDDLVESGKRPTTTVLSNTIEEADATVAEALGIAEGATVQAIVRLRYAQEQPIARMANYLPADRVEFSTEALENNGLYHLLRGRGIQLHSATQVIGARTATAAEARQLGESRGSSLLTMQRITFDDHGNVAEFGNHIYAASRYTFEMSLLSL